MLAKIYLAADFFYKDLTGGAELNDYSLIKQFQKREITIERKYCRDINVDFLKENKNSKFIIANFILLSPSAIKHLINNVDYVIYEHDHKYLKTRNPIFYKNFIAPSDHIINYEFYKSAKAVICLTQLAVDVLKENTGLDNIVKVGASVWADDDLDYIATLTRNEKIDKFAIMDSDNPIKKREKCIQYCEMNNIKYDLIKDKNYRKFLGKLSNYKGLVFMTGHLETCCRIIVEAKMLNCKVVTQQKLIGAASEPWFELSGEDLVEEIRKVSKGSVDIFMEALS